MSLGVWGGSRVEQWQVYLCDRQGNRLHLLKGVEPGGSIDLSAVADVTGQGKITLTSRKPLDIDWSQHWIRLWYRILEPAEIATTAAVLTGVPQPGPYSFSATGVSQDIQLYDPLSILAADTFGETWQAGGTTPAPDLIPIVTTLLSWVGIGRYVIPDNGAVLRTAMTWDRSVSKLKIANDLLAAAGYTPLWCDEMGVIRSEPYVDQALRPVAWDFGQYGIFTPDWSLDPDLWGKPNKLTVYQAKPDDGTAELPDQVAVLPASHPASFEHTGVWRPVVEEAVYDTTSVGLARAKARLEALSASSETRDIETPWLPNVRPRAIVRHAHPDVPDGIRATVETQRVAIEGSGDSRGLWETTLRRAA